MQCLKEASFWTGVPEKPTITNTEIEVDKDVIVTWSEAEANSSNGNIKYRLEWRKQPVTGSTEMVQRGNIEGTHFMITGLEYDTEYEVKLFAVNEQGDSEPDVRTFKTKSGMYLYLRLPNFVFNARTSCSSIFWNLSYYINMFNSNRA